MQTTIEYAFLLLQVVHLACFGDVLGVFVFGIALLDPWPDHAEVEVLNAAVRHAVFLDKRLHVNRVELL